MHRTIQFLILIALALPAIAQQAPAAPAPTNTLQLDDVVREVIAHNPALASAESAISAQKRRISPAGALPDPNVAVSWMGSAIPFKTQSADPSSYRGLSVMQMVPLGGKRELSRKMARKEVGVFEADRSAVVRRLRADAKAAYYDYFYYAKALELTSLNKARMQQLVETTESRYRVGKAMQQDVLRAQLEVSMLIQRSLALEQQRQTAAARLNTLMARAVDAPLPPAAEIVRSPLPSMAALLPVAEANDPMLLKEQRMVDRNKVAVAMAQKEGIPDLSVGYMYQQRPGMPDMYGMQFTVNLPIFNKAKRREQIESARIEVGAREQGRDARRLELSYELKQMFAMATSADQMLDLYDKGILPQAELTLESVNSSHTVGTTDFNTVVMSFTAIYGYQLDYYRQLADRETALARIEALTGDLGAGATNEAK